MLLVSWIIGFLVFLLLPCPCFPYFPCTGFTISSMGTQVPSFPIFFLGPYLYYLYQSVVISFGWSTKDLGTGTGLRIYYMLDVRCLILDV